MGNSDAIGNISAISLDNQLGIKSDTSPFSAPFYFQDFYDEAAIKKFTKNVEKLIRTSREYSTYIELLRTNCTTLNHDNILHNITASDASMEFHHYPFTLYDIVTIVMNSHVINKAPFTSFSIAKEVMQLHYRNIIGLVPLTKTTHELAHEGEIFLSTKQVFGNYKQFISEYGNAIPAELMLTLKDIEDKTKQGIPSDFGGLL